MPSTNRAEPGQSPNDVASNPSPGDIAESQRATEPLAGGSGMGSTAASALGSAMLGLDMAIRREPPAQVVAAEHQPERSPTGDDDLVIEIPTAAGPRHPAPAPNPAKDEP